MERKNCWEVRGCGLQPGGVNTAVHGICPAALPGKYDEINEGERAGRFCWSVAKTLCGGKVQESFTDKLASCLDCAFFHRVRDEEGAAFILNSDDEKNESGQPETIDIQKIATIAQRVFLFMIKQEIPIIPKNYRVWFEYHFGGNEELERTVRDKTSRGEALDAEFTERLYNQCFGDPDNKRIITLVEKHAGTILKEIIESILISHNDTTEYSNKLKQYSAYLGKVSEIKEIKRIIKNIIYDTKRAEESNLKLQKKLKEIASETENLKKEVEQKEKDLLKDPLTGLYNRRALQRKIEELFTDFKTNGSPFSIIMIDINLFKQFNSQYGHMIGDEALQIVSATLEENTKGKDFVGRFGGDEFILLLPLTTMYSAIIVAEHLRKAVSEKKLKLKSTGKSIEQISISLGVSQVRPGDSIESVTERADAALLLAKETPQASVKSEKDLC